MLSRWITSTVSIFRFVGLINWNMEELQNVRKTKGKPEQQRDCERKDQIDESNSAEWSHMNVHSALMMNWYYL
jgi:hypothetical protein